MTRPKQPRSILRSTLAIFAVLICISASSVLKADPVDYALSDLRVSYLFDDAKRIDWPTIFYLNDEFGCHVDLVLVRERFRASHDLSGDGFHQIVLHNLSVNGSDSLWANVAAAELFAERYPDILILGDVDDSSPTMALFDAILKLPFQTDRLFNILRIFRHTGEKVNLDKTIVTLNGRELANRYRVRMQTEIPELFPHYQKSNSDNLSLTRYELVRDRSGSPRRQADFVSGLERNRLLEVVDSVFVEGPRKKIITRQAAEFMAAFGRARQAKGPEKVGAIIDGYRVLGDLYGQRAFDNLRATATDFNFYLRDLHRAAENAALEAMGLNWAGRIILRDSPHGPKLKFRVAIGADSPLEVILTGVLFHPYWDTITTIVDSASHVIAPHQTFVREYLIDIERSRLESENPDSLRFSAQLDYRGHQMTLESSMSVWDRPDLNVQFAPDYQFVPPFSGIDIDRVIQPTSSKVIITKSQEYADSIKLDLKTPRGMFAGSYRSEHYLPPGITRKEVSIPFSLSNLFEKGLQQQTISLLVNGREIARDTGLVRMASCQIDDKIKIGFVPDSSGRLEDVLRMTRAEFRPLTDRSLMNYDLDAYNVIVIGSGAARNNPSLGVIKEKIEEYLRYGGSLVILGQPDDWPQSILPVSLIPYQEAVQQDEIENRIAEARILSDPYLISDKNLFSAFFRKTEVTSCAISPAEIVYITNSGGSILSVSRLGEGQIIYCGLPLMEMVSRLDIEAIHLLANILNY